MGKDTNHATIVRAFESRGATVVELHTIGGGVPDLLVGYQGSTRLVEVKRPARKAGRGLRSTKCATCRTQRARHDFGGERPGCATGFVADYGETKAPGGVVSNRQKKWHRSWPGCPIVTVETEAEVDAAIAAMVKDDETAAHRWLGKEHDRLRAEGDRDSCPWCLG